MHPNRLKILYIAGWGRSGSTLLDNILGQIEDFVSVGELRYVWDRGLQDNQRCGCGARFRDCAFWQDVFHRAFGGFDRVDASDMLITRQKYDHARMVLLRTDMRSGAMERYQGALLRLYHAASAVSGAAVVVDSSKTPSHGRILQGCAQLDLNILHLVRDARAVAYSWLRKKKTGDDDGSYMTRFSPLHSALLWNGMNVATEMLRAANPTRYLRIRYEDLVTAPRATLRAILGLMGKSGTQLPFSADGKVVLGPVHGFSGNPSRFERGEIELRQDDEWRTKLNPTKRVLVTTLTGLLLLRYGYLLGSFNRRPDHLLEATEATDPAGAD